MPDLTSAALFEHDGCVLVAHRRRPPFVGQWVLPMTLVATDEAAEDALRRHARDQFGIGLGQETFVETVYLIDPDDQAQYVANIFRTPILEGPMRFNAEGDYDDARWLAAADLGQLLMPPDLRVPLIKILSEPEAPRDADWSQMVPAASRQGTPLGERAGPLQGDSAPEPAPDNKAGWDAISAAYQEEVFGDRFGDRFMWSLAASEDDLHLLDDVRGKRVIVLGCGGGQDVVALDRMGAIAVGIDQSAKQIAYAKAHAARQGAQNASFVEGTVEDLSRFDDESFDIAVSAHALNYVERIEDCLRETRRVLKPGSLLAISVRHPLDAMLSEDAPLRVERPHWDAAQDWTWTFDGGASARFRQWFWPVSAWFTMLTAAGFSVETMADPQSTGDGAEGDAERGRLVPYSLYMKARRR
jgi:SAM-dependent methyltransferase/ADP-ribose pyrophosphatase YjhB (NUDIX family)